MELSKNDRVLFIGDSITDAGRGRYNRLPLGTGYPQLIGSYLLVEYPEHNFKFYNRGLSGDTLFDLARRFKADCLDLQVDVVSILIGINDIWKNYSVNQAVSESYFKRFKNQYKTLLDQIKDKKVIIMSPFVLPYPSERLKWRSDVEKLVEITHDLSSEYNFDFINLDQRLNKLGKLYSPQYYTGLDGIHPTEAGQAEIAKAWLENVSVEK